MSGAPAAAGRGLHAGEGTGATRRFDETFLRRLETLRVVTKRASLGQLRADRRSRRVGAGIEFADHRDYVAGDDLRILDWSLYGRMERLLVRLFEEDEDLAIDVLVDTSASMGVGAPPKLDLAAQIGAALAYVGLASLDRVAVTTVGEALGDGLPPARGKGHILRVLRFLEEARAVGRTSLADAARAFLARRQRHRRGLVVLLSDFYDPAGYREALDLLRFARFELVVIQISAPEEARPALRGDVTVRDVETGEERDVTISPRALAAYERRHAALVRGLDGFCRERAIPCFAVTSDEAFDAVVLRVFRAGGLLR
jgi:uncharacterized protein (DUF58 family)